MHLDQSVIAGELRSIGQLERRVLDHFVRRKSIARDPNQAYDERLTLGQRVADRVAAFGGSWTFIALFVGTIVVWMFLNTEARRTFDPYPFILLNLVLSCVAALQAPIIMMSQNRLALRDRIDAQHDYEVNLKAEMEIVSLHLKVDQLREEQWKVLIEMQERQLAVLQRLDARIGERV